MSRVSAPQPTVFARVLEHLGAAICAGDLAPGARITSQELEANTRASRSVVREATRVLTKLGMLRPTKRVGMVVLDDTHWDVLDPHVIRWSLASSRRIQQIRSLLEMRMAIEPEAARLAALNESVDLAGTLVSLAGELWSARHDVQRFADIDTRFHRVMLEASGNPMFARLANVIEEALHERALVQMREREANTVDVQLHVDLAGQIQRREADDAQDTARQIIARTAADSDT